MSIPELELPIHPPQNLTIATTGASGALFLRQFLRAVERDERVQAVNFVASDSALRVMAEELDLKGRSDLVAQILETPASRSSSSRSKNKIQVQSNTDIGANIASARLTFPLRKNVLLCSAFVRPP